MNKWERLNSELADARHYAADMKERVAELEKENASLRDDVADVLEIAIARGDSLGYCDDDYRQWLEELRPTPAAIAFEVQP